MDEPEPRLGSWWNAWLQIIPRLGNYVSTKSHHSPTGRSRCLICSHNGGELYIDVRYESAAGRPLKKGVGVAPCLHGVQIVNKVTMKSEMTVETLVHIQDWIHALIQVRALADDSLDNLLSQYFPKYKITSDPSMSSEIVSNLAASYSERMVPRLESATDRIDAERGLREWRDYLVSTIPNSIHYLYTLYNRVHILNGDIKWLRAVVDLDRSTFTALECIAILLISIQPRALTPSEKAIKRKRGEVPTIHTRCGSMGSADYWILVDKIWGWILGEEAMDPFVSSAGWGCLSENCKRWIRKNCYPVFQGLVGRIALSTPGSNRRHDNNILAAFRLSMEKVNPGVQVRVASYAKKTALYKQLSKSGVPVAPGIGCWIQCLIGRMKDRKSVKWLNRLYPPTSEVDARHMTTRLSNFAWEYVHRGSFRGLPEHADIDRSEGRRNIRRCKLNQVLGHIPIGTNAVLALGLLVAALGETLERKTMYQTLVCSGVLLGPAFLVQDRLKSLSTLARRCAKDLEGHKLTCKEVGYIANYELMFGRSGNLTDWNVERRNRCTRAYHIRAPGNLKFDEESFHWTDEFESLRVAGTRADAVFERMLEEELEKVIPHFVRALAHKGPGRGFRETFSSFIGRRHEWLASGSSGGYTIDAKAMLRGEDCLGGCNGGGQGKDKIKVQKRVWGEWMKGAELSSKLYGMAPREVATASEKMENGKSRAIYGVEPVHYVINTYATEGFEEALHHVPGLEKGASGLGAVARENSRAQITSDATVECTMLDYADFNRQHTPSAQATIFRVIARVGEGMGACADWIAANNWVAAAKEKQFVVFPDNGGRQEHVVQGMFSGTKSTDLINTLLNLCYFKVAQRYIKDRYNLEAIELYNVHQGDDVWLSNKNPLWARVLFYTMAAQGFVFQGQKQMFGQGRGEYLRVLYQDGHGTGYLARALVNYILRPIQNDQTMDPIAWVGTIRDGVSTLMRRGLSLDVGSCMWSGDVNFWGRVRSHPTDMAPVALPVRYMSSPASTGGLGLAPPGYCDTGMNRAIGAPTYSADYRKDNKTWPSNMTEEWLDQVSARLAKDSCVFNRPALRSALVEENYSGVLTSLCRDRGWAAYKKKMSSFSRSIKGTIELAEVPAYRAGQCEHLREKVVVGMTAINKPSDAIVHSMAASAVPLSGGARRDLLPILDLANRSRGEQCLNYISLGKELRKMLSSSRFKSEHAYATAYGMSRLEAVKAILSEYEPKGAGGEHMSYIVRDIVDSGQSDVLDYLLSGGKGPMTGLCDYWNKGCADYISSIISQLLIQTYYSTGSLALATLEQVVGPYILEFWQAVKWSGLLYREILY